MTMTTQNNEQTTQEIRAGKTMKIMQSKYYKPRQLVGMREESPHVMALFEDISYYRSKYNPFESLLDDLLMGVSIGNANLVMEKARLSEFAVCNDFVSISFNKTDGSCFEKELCYFHPELEVFFIANKERESPFVDEPCDLLEGEAAQPIDERLLRVNHVYYDPEAVGVLENVQRFFDEYLTKFESKAAMVSILLKEPFGINLKPHSINPLPVDLDTMYNADFGPVHEHIVKKLTDEQKGVVLLHGIPGSGKTNYIKWLTTQVPGKQFVFVPTTMIGALTSPEFMTLLIENRNSVLVLEDCENYIAERTASNVNTDMVATILNIADGILSDVLECQFICTFNSDISKVDEALLRKGRLIAEYKFDELSVERANAYLAAQNAEIALGDLPIIAAPISLAELTNLDDASYKAVIKESKIGFL